MCTCVRLACAALLAAACAAPVFAQGGDNCASPQVVLGPGAVSMDTNAATTQGYHASCDMISGSTWYNSVDIWYLYTAQITGSVEVHLSGCSSTITSSTASNLSLWSGCGASTSSSCSRTACNSSLTFPITAGNTYLVRAATFAISSSGTSAARRGTATVTFTEAGPPSNDTCATAAEVGAGTFNWNDALATPNGPLPSCCNTADQVSQRDLWYGYTASASGFATLASTNNWISVHGDCAESTTFGCASGSVTLQVTAGTRYVVRLARPAAAAAGAGTLSITEYPTPANDACETAQEVGAGEYAWNDSGAVANGPFPACGLAAASDQRDVWFAYTAAITGNATVDVRVATSALPGNNNQATIAAFNGCSGSEIVCASPAISRRWFCLPVISGQRYLIRLARAGSATREPWTVRIREFAAPAGDTWNTATALFPGTMTYSNAAACDVNEFESSVNCYGVASPGTSVWFSFDPFADGVASFDTSATTSIDTVLVAYGSDAAGNCNGQVLVCSNDLAPQYTLGSYISLPVHAGSRIYLRADIRPTGNSNGYYGNITLTTDLVDPHSNDNCSGATPIIAGTAAAPNTFTYDNRAATDSPGVPDPSCNAAGNLGLTRHDLWWSWTPTQNGVTRVSTCRNPAPLLSANATVLTIYSDCSLTHEVACNDDAGSPDASDFAWASPCTDEQSALHFSSTANTTYLIRVASHGEWIGPGVLNLSFVPNACVADFDNSGALSVQDIFSFLSAWFAGSSSADINGGGLGVSDIFDFLSAWFVGC